LASGEEGEGNQISSVMGGVQAFTQSGAGGDAGFTIEDRVGRDSEIF
jgi:hypothetical protein